jgi:hypothetical protein
MRAPRQKRQIDSLLSQLPAATMIRNTDTNNGQLSDVLEESRRMVNLFRDRDQQNQAMIAMLFNKMRDGKTKNGELS